MTLAGYTDGSPACQTQDGTYPMIYSTVACPINFPPGNCDVCFIGATPMPNTGWWTDFIPCGGGTQYRRFELACVSGLGPQPMWILYEYLYDAGKNSYSCGCLPNGVSDPSGNCGLLIASCDPFDMNVFGDGRMVITQ